MQKKEHPHFLSLNLFQLDGFPCAAHSNILTATVGAVSEMDCLSIRRRGGGRTPLMTSTQLRGYTFFAVTATLRVITMVTARLGGLGIIAKIAILANTLVYLGFLQLFAGHHTHVPRGRNIRRAPTLSTFSFRYVKASNWMAPGPMKSTCLLGGRKHALG